SALQSRGRGGRRARGDHPGQPRRQPGGAGAAEVGAVQRAARGPIGPGPLGVRGSAPPLRPAGGGRPRAARAAHPPRGLRQGGAPVTGGRRLAAVVAVLGGAAAAFGIGALFVGSAPVSPRAVLAVLRGGTSAGPVDQVVVLSLRLPRILAALLAGGALAVAGVGFQGLTRNPLAEPSVLGGSSGAPFGVVLAPAFRLRAR